VPAVVTGDPVRRLAPVVRLAPAKLNLTLAVLGRRQDGFHDLHSVVVPLALADRLSVAVQPAARADTLHVTGADTGPTERNLVLRAIAAARTAAAPLAGGPAALPPLAARLEKRIPVAAGLGGGSSDAAAALDAALEAWGVELHLDERRAVAARLGSDVPLFLAGGAALIEGRGEHVTGLGAIAGEPPGVLLVTPAVPLATAGVYAAFAAVGQGSGSTRLASEHLAEELRPGMKAADLVARAGVLASANDLIAPAQAVSPGLLGLRRALMRRLARPVGQSGSGPTLWSLYPSSAAAESAAGDIRAAFDSGSLTAPGGIPFVHATHIATAPRSDA
jgi:4-diphosphocytidyl-2-C-methyl-D-erythritol kinase